MRCAALAAAAACVHTGADRPASTPVLGAFAAVAHPAPAGSRFPHLAADDAGGLVLTWLEPAGASAGDTTWRVRFATRPAAGAWSAPRTVAEGRDVLVNWTDFPSVVPLGGGRLAAQWPVRDPRGDFAYFPRVALSADGGATWTPPAVPPRARAAAEYDFAVPFRAAGDSVGVVWLDGRATAGGAGHGAGHAAAEDFALRFTTLDARGALGADRVVEGSTCSCCRNAVAYTGRGAVLAYRDRAEGELRDIAVRRYEGGRWSAPTAVHADGWRIPGCPTNGAAIAARGDTVAVAWFTAPDGRPRVQVAYSADGGATFGAPVRADDGAPVGRVGVALAAGGAVVSWIERGSADGARAAALRARVVPLRLTARAQALAPAVTVASTAAARASGVPQLAQVGDTAYVAWTAVEGGAPSVRLARAALVPR